MRVIKKGKLPPQEKKMVCPKCCGNCIHFMFEDINGNGWCSENVIETTCGQTCKRWKEQKRCIGRNGRIY